MRNRSPHTSEKLAPQQRYAAAKSTVPSRKSATDATIQLVSPVLGSAAVVAVAAVGPVVGSPAAGLASAED